MKKILKEEKLYATPGELIRSLPGELKGLLFKQWNAKQNPEWHPEGNTLKHIIVVLRRAFHHYPDDPNMIMAALFHDLGKMDTYAINPKTNQPTAYGHEDRSTDYVDRFKEWIESFEGTDVEEIKYLVKNHMKVKPRTWDQMKDKKKEPIKSHPAFGKLMGFTDKLDGGGIDLKESIKRVIKEELSAKERTLKLIDDAGVDYVIDAIKTPKEHGLTTLINIVGLDSMPDIIYNHLKKNFYPDYDWGPELHDFYREEIEQYGSIDFYIDDSVAFTFWKEYGGLSNRLELQARVYIELNKIFGNLWEPIFKKWFEENSGLKVNAIVLDRDSIYPLR